MYSEKLRVDVTYNYVICTTNISLSPDKLNAYKFGPKRAFSLACDKNHPTKHG